MWARGVAGVERGCHGRWGDGAVRRVGLWAAGKAPGGGRGGGTQATGLRGRAVRGEWMGRGYGGRLVETSERGVVSCTERRARLERMRAKRGRGSRRASQQVGSVQEVGSPGSERYVPSGVVPHSMLGQRDGRSGQRVGLTNARLCTSPLPRSSISWHLSHFRSVARSSREGVNHSIAGTFQPAWTCMGACLAVDPLPVIAQGMCARFPPEPKALPRLYAFQASALPHPSLEHPDSHPAANQTHNCGSCKQDSTAVHSRPEQILPGRSGASSGP
jgi:hypothetical protein